jgi:hypothetical protein
MGTKDADRDLVRFLARYTPEIRALAGGALATMRKRLPGAVELVYDNYYALVIGFGPNERASDAIFSIVLYPQHVSLCFIYGASLPDPDKILNGSGNQVRHIRLGDAKALNRPEVRRVMKAAVADADPPIDRKQERRVVIRAVAAKQRSRRPIGHASKTRRVASKA